MEATKMITRYAVVLTNLSFGDHQTIDSFQTEAVARTRAHACNRQRNSRERREGVTYIVEVQTFETCPAQAAMNEAAR
jgi:hypothetical protein